MSVSGGRWRCPNCELFLRFDELEFCGLTTQALATFGSDVNANRGRVEFQADGKYTLLPEDRLRHGRQGNGAGGSSMKEAVIAEIE